MSDVVERQLVPDDVLEACLEAVAEGRTVKEFCETDGRLSRSTFYKLMRTDPEVARIYAQAKEIGAETLADELLEIADDSRNDYVERHRVDGSAYIAFQDENVKRSALRITTRQWLLERLMAGKYGNRIQHTGGGPGSPPIAHEHGHHVSPREEIARRLDALAGKRGK